MEGFTLRNMFALDFENFHDIVQGIVQNAVKEEKIEKSLEEIIEFWKAKEFPIIKHYKGSKDRGFIFGSLDDLLKIIDDNMVNLQNIAASQFIKPFTQLIQHWETTIQTISEVIEVWVELQKKWLYLEGVFIRDDIETQLPDIAKKFNEVDKSFKQIMLDTSSTLNVHKCCMVPGRKDKLHKLISNLDTCQKSLTNYLDNKRMVFPRFYFLNDDELLGILGVHNPELIQEYIKRLFSNLQRFELDEETIDDDLKIVTTALISSEEEILQLKTRVVINEKIEIWMTDIVKEMKESHRYLIKKAVYDYGKGKKPRNDWLLDFQGMIILAANRIWLTMEIEHIFDKIKEGLDHAMKEYLKLLNSQLLDVLTLMKNESLNNNDRKKLEMVVTVDVHSRDIVSKFVKDGVTSSQEFAWESQLKYYWIRQSDGLWINQATGSLEYSYEYMGLNEKLVITPLTDRLHLTITQALSMCFNVAVTGTTATGKTETIKDLARTFGRLCIATNCSTEVDHTSIGQILNGLAQCGTWGCFDEFNNINESVLSAISTHLYVIRHALQAKYNTFTFRGRNIALDSNIGIFVTTNLQYLNSRKIPESIKSLFRYATCLAPDNELICQVKLFSIGFLSAIILAKRITTFYSFAMKLLSKQPHYDFGLRSLKSVLYVAERIKKQTSSLDERLIIMQALREINLPKLVHDDVALFIELFKDIFPGLDCPIIEDLDTSQTVENILKNEGYTIVPNQVEQIIQLHEIMLIRQSTILVGLTGGGKSLIIKTLCNVHTSLNGPTKLFVLNPKAFTVSELYGFYNPINRKWTNGILSNIFREINKPLESSLKNEKRYIVFDGDIDALWIENLNSVMDDNKILTLDNQERITLQSYCHLLFEVGSLQYASPAAVSRAGMIYVDPKNLGYQPYLDKWINTRPEIEQQVFRETCDKFIPGAISLIIDGVLGLQQVVPLEMIIHLTALNMVTQFCQMVDSLYHCHLGKNEEIQGKFSEEIQVDKEETPIDEFDYEKALIQAVVIQACYFSLGAVLTLKSRLAFDEYMKKTSELMLIEDTTEKLASIRYLPITYPTLYDYVLDVENKVWRPWKSLVPEYVHNRNEDFCKILVPITNTLQARWYIKLMSHLEKPILFIGESGSSKTAIIRDYLKSLNSEKYNQLLINFSSRTKSIDVQKNIEAILEKRTKDLYGPLPGKNFVIFIDDINLPLPDCYGTQQPIAFLKLLFEYKGLYDRTNDFNWKQLRDVHYLTAMGQPVGRRCKVDSRFISLLSIFMVVTPTDENLNYIFNNILAGHLVIFPEEVREISKTLTDITINLYKTVKTSLLPIPSKFHYSFNIRDISKIYAGLLQSTPKYFSSIKQFLRLWRNEVSRVICDRLIEDEDQTIVKNYLESTITTTWIEDPEIVSYSLRDPLLFGDFKDACNENSLRFYEDVLDYEAVYNLFKEILEKYNEKNVKLEMILFNDVLDHLTRIHRALRLHNGHVLVIGLNGCGKKSIIKLASFAANYQLFEIPLHHEYNEHNFHDKIKKLYNLIAVENRRILFLFNSAQLINESFLEIVNDILVTGVIPALFVDDEMKLIISRCRSHVTKEGHNITKENLWLYLEERRAENLRIVLSMNPVNNNLRDYCQNYPGILRSTTIDWIFPWLPETFQTVANVILRDNINVPEEYHKNVVEYMVGVHASTNMYSLEFFRKTRQNNYITPTHFIGFINKFTDLLNTKKNYINSESDKLKKGLTKVSEILETLVQLSDICVIECNEVIKEIDQCDKLLASVEEEVQITLEKERINREKKNEFEGRKQKVSEELAIARAVLAEDQPDLSAAKIGLEELEKSDIMELQSFVTPPEPVRIIGECVVILEGLEEISWKNAQTLMNNLSFLQNFQQMDGDEITIRQQEQIKARLNESDKLHQIESISKAGYKLYKFILAMLDCWTIYQEKNPKMEHVIELKEEASHVWTLLNHEDVEFMKISKLLKNLNSKFNTIFSSKQSLQNKLDLLNGRLTTAQKLISGLSTDNVCWKNDLEDLQNESKFMIGNCLLSAGFAEYCGPFSYEFRNAMIFNDWQKSLTSKGIALSQPFMIENQLSSDIEIRGWNLEGLLSDNFSIQNGILTTHASKFILCIDPQQLAFNWIKQRESKKNLKIVSFYDSNFIEQLEIAIMLGFPIIFQDVDYIDPIVNNVLRKNIFNVGSQSFVMLGDKEVKYNTDFRIYLTTKLFVPKLNSEVYSNTTVINCTITVQGLANQLLTTIVNNEHPDVKDQRETLINIINDKKILLQNVAKSILSEILTNEGNILDNTDLVKKLEDLKSSTSEAEREISQAEVNIENINKLRDKYCSVADRSALLFFVLTDMAMINPMYHYSLEEYLKLFIYSLQQSLSDVCLNERIKNINQMLTKNFYHFGCMGIFEKDKLLFSFRICTVIEQYMNNITQEELDFFINGAEGQTSESLPENPINWLPSSKWKDLFNLSTNFSVFSQLCDQIQNQSNDWNKWFELDNPEAESFPSDNFIKLRSFQKLMLLKCFRTDRLYYAIFNYISEFMGIEFITSQNISFEMILEQSASTVPIIFILSPGADPTSEIMKLSDHFSTGKFKYLSLGQGQEQNALTLLDIAATKGHWLVLENCHLLLNIIRELEKMLETITIHPDFRLWLTTNPIDNFPVGMLQRSIKIVTEPPSGLKLKLKDSYSKIENETLECCSHLHYKDLIYVLTFFHAVIRERNNYNKSGWNINYDFNDSDFNISILNLSAYLIKSLTINDKLIPWASLKYLITDVIYGGKIINSYDHQIMKTYVEEYFGYFLFDEIQPFHFYKNANIDYVIPPPGSRVDYIEFIETLPMINNPEVLGLHSNSEMNYSTQGIKTMWKSLRKIHPLTSDITTNLNRDKYTNNIIEDIQTKIPKEYNILKIKKIFNLDMSPLTTVLFQELKKFNKLIQEMDCTLKLLKQAIAGEIVINSDLENLFNCLYYGILPEEWAYLAPATEKNLADWMDHFYKRTIQYTEWAGGNEPVVIWLSGLHAPETYLAALVQMICKKNNWPLDKTSLHTEVTKFVEAEEIEERFDQGCYVKGLYIEGARWDINESCLKKSYPKVLVEKFPVLMVVPVQSHQLNFHNIVKVPVYVTSKRQDELKNGLVFEVGLRACEHVSIWILQGICLLLNLK